MRYRLNQWEPALRGRFAHTKFQVAVHALSVRALRPREIAIVAGLNKRELRELLVELRSRGVLAVEGHAGETATSAESRYLSRMLVDASPPPSMLTSLRRWLTRPVALVRRRIRAHRRLHGRSAWTTTVTLD